MKKIALLFALFILLNCNFKRILYVPNSDSEIDYEEEISLKNFDQIYFRNNTLLDNNIIKNNSTKNLVEAKIKQLNSECITVDCRLGGYEDYQYMIVSGDNIIYISTTPSNSDTKNRNYYLKNTKNPESININSYYFNTFLLGKKMKSKEGAFILFKDKKIQNHWRYNIQNDTINITRLDTYKKKYKDSDSLYITSIIPSKSINTGFSFIKINNFNNFYFNDLKEKKFDDHLPAFKKFILQYKDNVLKSILVLYDKTFEINGEKVNAEKYLNSRLKYSQDKESSIINKKQSLNNK